MTLREIGIYSLRKGFMDSLRKGEVVVPCGIRGVGSNFATLHLCNVVKHGWTEMGGIKPSNTGCFIVFSTLAVIH